MSDLEYEEKDLDALVELGFAKLENGVYNCRIPEGFRKCVIVKVAELRKDSPNADGQ